MREIQKELGMATGVLEYHLNYLVKEGLLTTYMDGRKKRFYSAERVSGPQKKLLSFLRQKHTRRILTLSLAEEGTDVEEIMRECGISKAVALSNIRNLMKEGYIREDGGRYFATDPGELAKMLITYRESYLDDVVDRFVDSFGGL